MTGAAKRVRVYLGQQDRVGGTHLPLWEEIIRFLDDNGAAGATVFRGIAGYGTHRRIHTARIADFLPDLPVVVEWIDTAETVARLLPKVHALVPHGTVTVEDVELL